MTFGFEKKFYVHCWWRNKIQIFNQKMAKHSGDDETTSVPRLMVNDSDNTSTGWQISQFSKTSVQRKNYIFEYLSPTFKQFNHKNASIFLLFYDQKSCLLNWEVGDLDEGPKRREIRLRRCPSTSKVETIVTEDEKLRRAQPDKP